MDYESIQKVLEIVKEEGEVKLREELQNVQELDKTDIDLYMLGLNAGLNMAKNMFKKLEEGGIKKIYGSKEAYLRNGHNNN